MWLAIIETGTRRWKGKCGLLDEVRLLAIKMNEYTTCGDINSVIVYCRPSQFTTNGAHRVEIGSGPGNNCTLTHSGQMNVEK